MRVPRWKSWKGETPHCQPHSHNLLVQFQGENVSYMTRLTSFWRLANAITVECAVSALKDIDWSPESLDYLQIPLDTKTVLLSLAKTRLSLNLWYPPTTWSVKKAKGSTCCWSLLANRCNLVELSTDSCKWSTRCRRDFYCQHLNDIQHLEKLALNGREVNSISLDIYSTCWLPINQIENNCACSGRGRRSAGQL